MAKWFNQFRENLKNTRIRIIFILVVVVLVIALVFGISRAFRTEDTGGAARIASVPGEIQSVPGAQTESKQYLKTLLQSNREAAKEALRTGHSEIATMVATPKQAQGADLAALSAPQKQPCCSSQALEKALVAYEAKKNKEASTGSIIQKLEESQGVTPKTAALLKQLAAEKLASASYAKRLAALVKAGKLSPSAAQRLLAAYKKSQDAKASSGALNGLADENVTPEAYEQKLAGLIKAGSITPAQAKRLLAAYEKKYVASIKPAKGATSGLAQLQREQAAQKAQQLQQQLSQEQVQLQQQQTQQLQAERQAMQAAISSQIKQLLTGWAPPKQAFVGELSKPKQTAEAKGQAKTGTDAQQAASSEASSTGKTASTGKSIVKTGAILFAVLDTAVNSDQPGPVMATVVSGKYKGAKLLGSLQVTSDHERVILRFDVMSMNDWPEAVKINAVAINPDTARTALASDVDNHYLQRYGALFAASFLEGLGDAVKQSGNTVTNNAGTTTQTFDDLNTADKAIIGLGQVGKDAGQAAKKVFDRQPTITVDAGIGLGILFTQDVKEPVFLEAASKQKTQDKEEA